MAQKEKMYLGFLVSISIPGHTGFLDTPKSEEYWNLYSKFEVARVKATSVDTIPGWFNLNQDWIQVYVPIEGIKQDYYVGLTDWWPAELRELLEKGLLDGSVIMMVSTISASRRVPKKTKKNYSEFKQKLFEKVAQGFNSDTFKEYGIKFEEYH